MSENYLYAVLLKADDLHPQTIMSSLIASGDVCQLAKTFIGCTYIEAVRANGIKYPYRMLVDEQGMFEEKPVLNILASFLYGTQFHGQPIVGNAVLVADQVLPNGDHDLRLLTKQEAKAAEVDLQYVALAAYKLVVAKMQQSGTMEGDPPSIDKLIN